MCEKCVEIDEKIEHYRLIKRSIMDQLTVDRAKELIAELEAQKAALHPNKLCETNSELGLGNRTSDESQSCRIQPFSGRC